MAKFKVIVPLIGSDGNAFMILGKVQRALKKAGATKEDLANFHAEATSGDYDQLLKTVVEWVEVGYE